MASDPVQAQVSVDRARITRAVASSNAGSPAATEHADTVVRAAVKTASCRGRDDRLAHSAASGR